MSLDDTKEKLELRKSAFEIKQKNTYGIENHNDMTRIHDNEVNNIAKSILMHYIINTPKHTKKLNNHYSSILHGCTNKKRAKKSLGTLEYYWIVDVFPRW